MRLRPLLATLVAMNTVAAQDEPRAATFATVPRLASVSNATSELANVVDRFAADENALTRRYDAADSPARRKRMREFYTEWRQRLREHAFDRLSQEGKVDYVLLDNHLQHEIALLDRRERQLAEIAPLLPFSERVLGLQDARRNLEPIDHPAVARTLAEIAKQIDSLRALFEPAPRQAGQNSGAPNATADTAARPRAPRVSRTVANRAAENLESLRRTASTWYRYYDGYDPMFTWWAKDPYRKLDSALMRYTRT
ncbi:MAG: hypothetical protein ACREOK_14925, partial [Gemmatimonadaceae bacterium]